jgi:ubiquinone/menaquinone biosynthesis C-methylase UbiE
METFSQRFAQIPPQTVAKVNGVATEDGFIYIGKCIADAIEKEIAGLAEVRHVLDFGCGLGRVMAQLLPRAPQAEFVGFDIDPMMLHWSSLLLGDTRTQFVSTTLDLPDESFDLIVVISVFTHLDITTDFWLTEIHRLLSPRGKAFLTFHDETLFAEMAKNGQISGASPDTILSDCHVVGNGTAEGGASMGTFYTTKHWDSLLGRYFTIHHTAQRGLFCQQSYSLISKKPVTIDRTVMYGQYARSLEQDLFNLRKQHSVCY